MTTNAPIVEYDESMSVFVREERAKLHIYCVRIPTTQIQAIDFYLERQGGMEHLGLRYDRETDRILPFDSSDTDLAQGVVPLLAETIKAKMSHIEGVIQPRSLLGQLEAYVAFSELEGSNSN